MTIPYGRHHITSEDEAAVIKALRSDFLTQGPAVEEFEKAFATYVGSKYAVAVTNGTAALHLSAMALNVRPGDKVIVPGNTFVASANCVLYCGGDVEFVDIDPATYCIDLEKLETKLMSQPQGYFKGIVAVDFAGHPVNLEKLSVLAKKHGCWIIEDACHAPGASFKAQNGEKVKSGSCHYSDLSIFSFHPVKHIACGEGGMITTNDPSLYKKIKLLRTHGISRDVNDMSQNSGPWYYEMQELGFNYRMPDILCALGLSQLSRADGRLKRRQEIAKKYDQLLAGLPLKKPAVFNDLEHAYHLYVIQVENRSKVFSALRENKIFAQVHYIPVYQQPYYIQRYGKQEFKVNDAYYERCISLPMFPELTDQEIEFVVQSLKKAL